LHPIIRLACFILLLIGLTVSNLFFIVVVPLFLIIFKCYCSFSSVLPLVKRLRWFFLSLLILNLSFSFDLHGLLIALHKIAVLIIIVLAAYLLMFTTSIKQLIAALLWWLYPFQKLGFSTLRFAVRLSLILETVESVQKVQVSSAASSSKNPIKKITETVSNLFIHILDHAETAPLRSLEIPETKSPPLWQWIYPMLLMIGCLIT
jgi:energy-coupling factor transporter transmembrane protein EcfT